MADFASDLLRDLRARGFIKDCTDLAGLDALLASGRKIAVYAGFDPTADSLHVGHMVSLTLLRRFKEAGHTVVPVVGTATAMVGDPSGRSSARPMLDDETMRSNADGIEDSIRRGLGEGGSVLHFRNGLWFEGKRWIDFLREVGSAIPVSRLLALESVRSRLGDDGEGLSFLELSYSLMQAFDFLTLSWEFRDLVQVGGSDQWGNICLGIDLIAKRRGPMRGGAFDTNVFIPGQGRAVGHAFGLTHPLLVKSNGEKMGKSAGNAVWINPGKLGHYEFFRFFRTVDDADAVRVAKLLSDRPVTELQGFDGADGRSLEALKEMLAFELTARVRGDAAAQSALSASRGRGAVADGLPEITATTAELVDLPELLVRAGLISSKAAARRLSAQGGLRVNGASTDRLALGPGDFRDGVAVVSAGKTKHAAVRLAD